MTQSAINFCLHQAQTEEDLYLFFFPSNVDAAPKVVTCTPAIISPNLLQFLQPRASCMLTFQIQEHTNTLELNYLFRVKLPSDFQQSSQNGHL